MNGDEVMIPTDTGTCLKLHLPLPGESEEKHEKWQSVQPVRNGAASLHSSQWTVCSFQGRSSCDVVETGDAMSLGAVR
jgi:hypothetical protein